MFRPLLGHLQALWENRSKRYLYFNALWDPKCVWDPTMHWNRYLLDLFSQRAWRWPNKGRNMSPWQYTIFIEYKVKCCVIDWHVVFVCYNTSGWKTLNVSFSVKGTVNIQRPLFCVRSLKHSFFIADWILSLLPRLCSYKIGINKPLQIVAKKKFSSFHTVFYEVFL